MTITREGLRILGDIATNAQNLLLLEKQIDKLVPFVGAGLSADFGYPTWNRLLQDLAGQTALASDINRLIARSDFEQAAEIIVQELPTFFDNEFRSIFDHHTLRRPISNGAAQYVPGIARGIVLTTNFDRVLEASFEDHGSPFDQVFPGSRIREAFRAIQLNERVLLKLHGDYWDSDSRVLTLSEYVREYGNPDPSQVDFERPLPKALTQALSARPLLFLGCSLQNDRTTRVIATIAQRLPGTIHFALLPEPTGIKLRCKQLDSWNILPLFFPVGEYNRVEQFLACLANSATQAGHAPRRDWNLAQYLRHTSERFQPALRSYIEVRLSPSKGSSTQSRIVTAPHARNRCVSTNLRHFF